MIRKIGVFAFLLVFAVFAATFVSANSYIIDTYFTIPDSVFMTNEKISLKGYLFLTNYTSNGTLVNSSYAFANANINFTIRNSNGSRYSNYSFTTDSIGAFYSSSTYYVNATNVSAPAVAGSYSLKAQYLDGNNTVWFSEVSIEVVNKTVDSLGIRIDKARYNPSETIIIETEAVRLIGDKKLYVNNVSINGSLRNANKIRALVGVTNPEKADPTSLRGKYGRINSLTGVLETVVHSSASPEEAEREIKLWFSPDELTETIYQVKKENKAVERIVWK